MPYLRPWSRNIKARPVEDEEASGLVPILL